MARGRSSCWLWLPLVLLVSSFGSGFVEQSSSFVRPRRQRGGGGGSGCGGASHNNAAAPAAAPVATTAAAAWRLPKARTRKTTSTTAAYGTSKSSEEATAKTKKKQQLTAEQLDFVRGYLNKHHGDFLVLLAQIFSPIGAAMAQANVWSGGSYALVAARLVDITTTADATSSELRLDVTVQERGKPERHETVAIPLDAVPIPEKARQVPSLPLVPDGEEEEGRLPIDDVVRRLCRLTWMVGQPEVSGKLVQVAIQLGGAGVGKLPENLYLNQVPHNSYVRQYFYDQCATAVHDAVVLCSQGRLPSRMKVISQFPEMNPAMDSYRIGTILEMVRAVTIRLAEENLRVRVCVQASMGVGIFTGLPKQLSGVSRLVQQMDWQSGPGETNEGMVGDYVNFGAVGAEHVANEEKRLNATTGEEEIGQRQDDVFLLIAPQSMVGTDSSIMPLLQAMADAAGDRPVILFNPDLTDRMSSGGQQSVRGRQARLDFADGFKTVYHFQNIYVSGTSYFPILGAMAKMHPREPWIAHQRRDFAGGDKGEIYVPVLASETMPDGEAILKSFEQ